MPAKYIPDGYHTVTPYLIIKGASRAIEFYSRVFGAKELMRVATPDGQIGHAEIKIGDCCIMLADEMPQMGYHNPEKLGGTPVCLLLYLADVDKVYAAALAAGATALQPIQDQFYGDRSGTLKDPFGHIWTLATHVEDVPPEEMARRAQAHMKESAKQAAAPA